MSNVRSSVVFFLYWLLLLGVLGVDAAPKRKGKDREKDGGGNGGGNGDGQDLTPQQQAAQIAGGISKDLDRSTILDTTSKVKYVFY